MKLYPIVSYCIVPCHVMSCGVVSCHIVELPPSRVSFPANRHFVFYFWWIFLLILWLAAVYEPYVISDEQSRQSKEGCGEGCGWIPSCSALAKYRNVLPDIIASLLFLISVVSLVYTVTAHTHTHTEESQIHRLNSIYLILSDAAG